MGAKFAHIFNFGRPVTKIVGTVDIFSKHETWLALLAQVGGRSGATGGRGRLLLRALKVLVSHVQHALLSLDEVRRIYRLRLCRRLLFLRIRLNHIWDLTRLAIGFAPKFYMQLIGKIAIWSISLFFFCGLQNEAC